MQRTKILLFFYNLTNVLKCEGNNKEDKEEHEAKNSIVVQINFDEKLKFLEEWLEKPKYDTLTAQKIM